MPIARHIGSWVLVALASGCGGATAPSGADASTASGGSSSNGSGGTSGSSGGGSSGSSGGSTSSGGSGGNCPSCQPGLTCCNGVTCIDPQNDPHHCGGCGNECVAPSSFCMGGTCGPIPCSGQTCAAGDTCCGSSCCAAGDICCEFVRNLEYIGCYTPTAQQPSCPPGCPTCISDHNVKRDVVPVDPEAVLESVARLPVSTWSYKKDDPSVRHMGPMAQDFYGEFGLGDSDKSYSPVDAHGVAFAAIRALYERMQQQQARIEELARENAELRRECRAGAGEAR